MSFRLKSISLENFRRFESVMTLTDLSPGLNLITGPNGAGKSTLALALRKLFFLYHRSRAAGVAKEMVPWSAPGESPAVSAQFEIASRQYTLSKQWMKGAYAKLETPDEMLDGDQAEQAVAQLLGYEAAVRGETQLHGIPGLLWIEQGASPDLSARLEPASSYLREALGSAVGEVTSTDGDEVLAGLQTALGELRRRGSGTASKGALAQATAQLESVRSEIDSLESRVLQYRQRVDELATLERACESDQRDQPWRKFQLQAEQTREALQALNALQNQAEQEQASVRTLDAQLAFIEAEMARGEQLRQAIEQREADDLNANELLRSAVSDHERSQESVVHARAFLDLVESAVEQARFTQRILELETRVEQISTDCARQRSLIAQADSCTEKLREIRESLLRYPITDADLEQLRQWDQEIAHHSGRAAAAATRLEFKLAAQGRVALDGRTVTSAEQATLVRAATLSIEGVGEVRVTPGGTELEESERARERLEKDRQRLLRRLEVTSSGEALAQLEEKRRLLAAAQTEGARLADFAPRGSDHQLDQLKSFERDLQQTQTELKQLIVQEQERTTVRDGHANEADPAAFDEAHAQWSKAVTNERRTGDAVSQARIRVEHTGQEVAAARQSLLAWEAGQQGAKGDAQAGISYHEQLSQLQDKRERSKAVVSRLETQIESGNPQTLALDLQRFNDSALQAKDLAEARRARRDLLAAQLSEAGAGGLEEALQQARADEQRWARREAELQTRADALTWLVTQISTRRQALTERLQAPLKDRMNHYLSTLLPGASVQLGTDLLPESILAPESASIGIASAHQQPVTEQSFGTREQVSLLARLAYADLLAQANRPTFLLLDDGLLNADDHRLEQIKRMLYDAAQRHQILIFSCHPDRWAGLGVAARELSAGGVLG